MKRSIKLNALKNKSDELSINQRPMAERAGAKNVAVWGETRIDECIEVLTLFFSFCALEAFNFLYMLNCWVRITVSTRDFHSRNRSSILLPSTNEVYISRRRAVGSSQGP